MVLENPLNTSLTLFWATFLLIIQSAKQGAKLPYVKLAPPPPPPPKIGNVNSTPSPRPPIQLGTKEKKF